MRIVVMSDSHGRLGCLDDIVQRNPRADIFVHLGDGESEADTLKIMYPQIDLRYVRGNCDYESAAPQAVVFEANGVKVLAVHGHNHGVKYGLERLRALADENGASVVLFGHTHERYEAYDDGVYFLNPGSASCPRDGNRASYGYVDILPSGIITNIVDL